MDPDRGNAESAPTPQRILAARLNLLMDAVTVQRGRPYTAAEVIALVAHHGVSLSRARWSYLLNGTRALTSDARLLVALAKVFEVEVEYLVDLQSTLVPELVESRIELIRRLREARVQSFAARSVGEISPGLVRHIADYIEKRDAGGD
jgi:transcriptional regulator with XRE-family HTH domain